MSRAKRLQLGFITFAFLYAVVGNYTWIVHETEYFPLYSWDLFSFVPSYSSDFAIRFSTIDGDVLEPPLYFNEADHYIAAAQTIEAFALTQRLGTAVYTNNGEADALRAQFEALYLRELGTVDYDLVIRRYDAIAYAQSGTVDEVILLQRYQQSAP